MNYFSLYLKGLICFCLLFITMDSHALSIDKGYRQNKIKDLALIYQGGVHRIDWTSDQFLPYVVHQFADGHTVHPACLQHVAQEAGHVGGVGHGDVKALSGGVHHPEDGGCGGILFQVTGLAVVQMQQHTAAAGGNLTHETVFIKIFDTKHKNTSCQKVVYLHAVFRVSCSCMTIIRISSASRYTGKRAGATLFASRPNSGGMARLPK